MALLSQSAGAIRCLASTFGLRSSARLISHVRPKTHRSTALVGACNARLPQLHGGKLQGVRSAVSSAAPAAGMKAAKPLTAKGDIADFQLNQSKTSLAVTWKDGSESNFHSLWLRYSCHCKQCLEEHTGQRLFLCENLDPDATIQSVEKEGDSLVITWGGQEQHTGFVPVQFLKEYDHSSTALKTKKEAITVNTFAKSVPELQYKDVVEKDEGLYQWLNAMSKFGFCVIKGVPTEEFMVVKVAEMIGPIQDTIYDDTFDVHVSDHQLTNVAYSADKLVYHQDLLYYESPPGIQFLHCLRFDACVTGGESFIADTFKVAEEFRKTNPAEFAALATIPATFQKIHYGRKSPVHMTFTRPLISLNPQNQIVGVYWEPPHEGPIEVPEEQVEAFYRAHIAFAKAVNSTSTQFEFRLDEGDLLVFNNRRVVHNRNAFVPNGGTRHLKGCYVNIDHFKSKVMVMSHLIGDGTPCKRVGNNCMF